MKKQNIRPAVRLRRSVAAALLRVSPQTLAKLKLRCWKEGRVTFYDPGQIAGLMALRDEWLKMLKRRRLRHRALRIIMPSAVS